MCSTVPVTGRYLLDLKTMTVKNIFDAASDAKRKPSSLARIRTGDT